MSALFFHQGLGYSTPKVKLSLYYESLCGGCKQFITEQLGPNYPKFAKYLDVELNPYGNAHVSMNSKLTPIFQRTCLSAGF